MFDPTVFENLKVSFENHLYDLDNIDQKILIQNRKDQMDFATLSRCLSLEFILADQPEVIAELRLESLLEDLAGEILEMPEAQPGCTLLLRFTKPVSEPREQCRQIEEALYSIWEDEIELTQTISFVYGQDSQFFTNRIAVRFKPKLTEEHMGDIKNFLTYVLESLEQLQRIE
ncbi:hypothetical protein J14TS2_23450 [Bacillus sp. J14TS2]|uniref:hypothetical protein n=1 Tax=Bacillus sp. J14TS2 TaxID=2807188 RepID=UPI001AFDD9E2|nr:hypothetical protein [Bacillus sp. J14TS2]GIN71870.1 hypothetical protein J14TS2_23450 [Bacillus sp. J14TS2]